MKLPKTYRNGTAYCTNHSGVAELDGGAWLIHPSGKTRRWLCAGCLQRRADVGAKFNGKLVPTKVFEKYDPAAPKEE